jgi:hypothetical protein
MSRLFLRPGASLLLASRIGGEPYRVTVVGAGPLTVRYFGQDRVIRSMSRGKFMTRAHAARGEQYAPPKLRVPPSPWAVSQDTNDDRRAEASAVLARPPERVKQ